MNEALNNLICDHLWIVKSVAASLKARLLYSADWDELISAGNLGIVRAAHNFRGDNNCTFKTYAFKCVRGEMIKSFTRIDGHHDSALIQWEALPEDKGYPAQQENLILRKEESHLFSSMLDTLKPRQRAVMDLYLRGDSLVAYAKSNGWKRDRVMKWQRTAIAQLKRTANAA